ncbi:hypothetical protein KKE45_02755 [Patescibacteria group bacterium]|nr:hypothetical protein [Patescibacteria group bacterium]
MNKKTIILICLTLTASCVFGFKAIAGKKSEKAPVLGLDNPTSAMQKQIPADKIEVFHFHGTRQCRSCIAVGEYALATIKEKFGQEYESGKIVFKDINSGLVENSKIVAKYQAVGSSLFVNAIIDKKDNIKEDTAVWRLVNNRDKFVDYFENKLKNLLGK